MTLEKLNTTRWAEAAKLIGAKTQVLKDSRASGVNSCSI